MSKITKQKYHLVIICPNCGKRVAYSSKSKSFQCRNCGFADYDADGMIKVKTIKTERVVEEPTASPLQPLLNIVESYMSYEYEDNSSHSDDVQSFLGDNVSFDESKRIK